MRRWIKQAILTCWACFFSNILPAQSTSQAKGHLFISAGYGAPSIIRTFLKVTNTHNDYWIVGYGPYMFKLEYLLNDRLSVGLNGTYSFSRLSFMFDGYDPALHKIRPYEYGVEMEDYSLLLRSNYHYYTKKHLDLYAGAGIGYGRLALGTYSTAPLNEFSVGFIPPKPLSLEATAGIRYYVWKRLAIYSEIGLGKSWLLLRKYFIPESVVQAGLCYKL